MSFYININGEIFPEQNAKISVLDRGFLYGDSVFEVIRTYQGKPFALEPHLQRLAQSARRLAIALPEQSQIERELHRTLGVANNAESYCRIIVTRGEGPITLDPTTATKVTTVIMVKDYVPFPEWMYTRGIRLAIPNVRRTSRKALDPAIKSGNYLNSVIAFGEAKKRGFDDAVILGSDGFVTESTSSNVLVVKNGTLCTPPLDSGLLAGVTRRLVLRLARDNDIPTEEKPLTVDDLNSADEVMLTSTLREVMPVVSVEQQTIGTGKPGPVTERLAKIVHKFTRESVRQ